MELPVFFCVALVLLHIVVNLLDNLCPSFFFPSDEYQLQSADAMMFHSGGEHQWLSSILGLLSRQMSKNIYIYTHIFHHLESHSLYGNKKICLNPLFQFWSTQRCTHQGTSLCIQCENPYNDRAHLSTPSSSNLEGSFLRTEQEILFLRTGIFLLAQI